MSTAMALSSGAMWFFSQWIYSKQVPRYKFDYKIEPGEGDGVTVKATLTQSEVDDRFTMAVPIYIELDKERIFRAGTINIRGSRTADKLEFKLPNKPKRILINARHDILERL